MLVLCGYVVHRVSKDCSASWKRLVVGTAAATRSLPSSLSALTAGSVLESGDLQQPVTGDIENPDPGASAVHVTTSMLLAVGVLSIGIFHVGLFRSF